MSNCQYWTHHRAEFAFAIYTGLAINQHCRKTTSMPAICLDFIFLNKGPFVYIYIYFIHFLSVYYYSLNVNVFKNNIFKFLTVVKFYLEFGIARYWEVVSVNVK